jgi:hypothetical protein
VSSGVERGGDGEKMRVAGLPAAGLVPCVWPCRRHDAMTYAPPTTPDCDAWLWFREGI